MRVRAIVTLGACALLGCSEPLSGSDMLNDAGGKKSADAGSADTGSVDSHSEWTLVDSDTDVDLTGVHFLTDREGWVAGQQATLQHTLNAGKTWETVPPLGIDTTGGFTAVQFIDEKIGWAAGPGLVVRTLDGGSSWRGWDNSDLRAGTPTFYGLFALSSTAVWTVGGVQKHTSVPSCERGTASCPTLWHTHFPTTSEPRDTQQHLIDRPNLLKDVFFASASTGYAVGTDGYILRVTNASTGMDITLDTQDAGIQTDLNAVYMLDEQTAWVVGNDGVVLHTTNGKDWESQSSGIDVDLFDVQFVDEDRGWAVGGMGTVLRTTNGGEKWSQMTTDESVELRSLSFPSQKTGFAVGGKGTVLKWSEADDHPDSNR